jgi:hypothetical protein
VLYGPIVLLLLKYTRLSSFTSVLVLSDYSNQQGVVDDFMLLKKLRIFANDFYQFGTLTFLQVDGSTLLEVVVFFGGGGVCIVSVSSYPRTLEIISLHDFLLGAEHVGHNNKIAAINFVPLLIFLNEFVKPVKLDDHSLWIFLEVVVVILEDAFK